MRILACVCVGARVWISSGEAQLSTHVIHTAKLKTTCLVGLLSEAYRNNKRLFLFNQ